MKITKENVAVDLFLAKKIINHANGFDSDKPYCAATQNLTYIPDLAKDEVCAFTITGSSDNIMELVGVSGITDIVTADVNPFAKYIFYLKKAAIKTLSAKEYISFMLEPNIHSFLDRDIFETRVMHGFDKGEELYLLFWIQMLRLYSTNQILHSFFKPDFSLTSCSKRESCMTYIKRENYQRIQKLLPDTNITLYEEDPLTALDKNVIFGFVDISNILIFAYEKICHCQLYEFKNYVKRLRQAMRRNISPDGICVIDYVLNELDFKSLLRESNPTEDMPTDEINCARALFFRILNEEFDIISLNTDKPISVKDRYQVILAKRKK